MMIMGGIKYYKDRKAKKEGRVCPKCEEKKQVEFATTAGNSEQGTCMKCGNQWNVEQNINNRQ